MKPLRSGAGHLHIDHRGSPGLKPSDVAHIPGAIAVGEGQQFETDVFQCSHCQRTILLHAPTERMRLRGYCQKCHHYICNRCEAVRAKTLACVPMRQVLDVLQESAAKLSDPSDRPSASSLIVLTDATFI